MRISESLYQINSGTDSLHIGETLVQESLMNLFMNFVEPMYFHYPPISSKIASCHHELNTLTKIIYLFA